ncbi:MAG: hypothetical protein HYR88_18710 [Verrucomicrobia bacterium]|nr:hypothetical protein [Verrucomicrobiota bacterium]MBI3870746.1 hypothetical protein [Verrucomicrobiota bacterium]
MLWIKRNLFFVLSLLVALGLFGYGCFYLFSKWNENGEVQKQLEQTEAELKKIYEGGAIFPNATNIALLRQQDKELKLFLADAVKTRSPVEYERNISASNFKTLLDNTLADLNKQAERARIFVAQRDFSFATIKPLVNFAEGSVPSLAEQLAEIKLISEILFRSEIVSLESIKREPVSKDDSAGAGSVDYHAFIRRTNDLTGDVSSIYQVTFLGFSETVASVLNNVGQTREGMTVKLLSVVPGVGGKMPLPGAPFGGAAAFPPAAAAQTGVRSMPTVAGGARPAAGASAPVRRLDTMADEKSFRVSMLLEIAKPGAAAPTP